MENLVTAELKRQVLPESFRQSLEDGIFPCAAYIAAQTAQRSGSEALVWGVNGAQGTGKSTLVRFLELVLTHSYRFKVATLSIDDFYLSKADRQRMAQQVHPLFVTRGVPGTHQVELGCEIIRQLKNADANTPVKLPGFDKAQDDCVPPEQWREVTGPFDLILFEGWCVGCQPQPDNRLTLPVNELEAEEDSTGVWRGYVNQQLRSVYPAWYNQIDRLILLACPGFEQVLEWRSLQESKLLNELKRQGKPVSATLTGKKQLERFIQHYERLTRWSLATLPPVADVVLPLRKDHRIAGCQIKAMQPLSVQTDSSDQ